MTITKEDIEHCKRAAKEDVYQFYKWSKWYKIREEVLKMDKYECQLCKRMHRYSPAETVHHTYEFKKYPQFALFTYVDDPKTGIRTRNLISLCNRCHNEIHNRFKAGKTTGKKFMNEERWD